MKRLIYTSLALSGLITHQASALSGSPSVVSSGDRSEGAFLWSLPGGGSLDQPIISSDRLPLAPNRSYVSDNTLEGLFVLGGIYYLWDVEPTSLTSTYVWELPVTNYIAVAVLDGRGIALATKWSGNLAVLDTTNHAVLSEIPTASATNGLCLSPGQSIAYVTDLSGVLYSVNTSTLQRAGSVSIGGQLIDCAVSPNGLEVYVTDSSQSLLHVVQTTQSLSLVASIPLSVGRPQGIDVHPSGQWGYTTHFRSPGDSVSVIDLAGRKVVATASTPDATSASQGIAVSPDGRWLYTLDMSSVSIAPFAIDSSGMLTAQPEIKLDGVSGGSFESAEGLLFNPSSQTAYVAHQRCTSLYEVDVASRTIRRALPLGTELLSVDMSSVSSSDLDQDGVVDEVDNCPEMANPDQSDCDGDGIGDVCDDQGVCCTPTPPGGRSSAAIVLSLLGVNLFVLRRRRLSRGARS